MSTLREAISEALFEHEMDWRINFDGLPYTHEYFCSCGATGYENENEHRAEIAISAIADWLEDNEPPGRPEAQWKNEMEEARAWGWDDGYDATIAALRNSLTPDQAAGKVES